MNSQEHLTDTAEWLALEQRGCPQCDYGALQPEAPAGLGCLLIEGPLGPNWPPAAGSKCPGLEAVRRAYDDAPAVGA